MPEFKGILGEKLGMTQIFDDARAVLNAAGCASAHLVGHSLGGLVALNLALAERSRVRSLSLLCTFARGKDATRLTLAMLWVGARTRIVAENKFAMRCFDLSVRLRYVRIPKVALSRDTARRSHVILE